MTVAWVAAFTWRSSFFLDDIIYFRAAQRQGLSLGYLLRPLNLHLSPGYRFSAWLFQSLFPLNFAVAQVLLLACLASAVVLVHRILVELFGPGRGPLLLAALYGTSIVHVGVIQWWSSGVQSTPTAVISLVCILAYLRFDRTGARPMLVLSVGALVLALLFYVKALLVPGYLVLLKVLLLDRERSVADNVRGVLRAWRLWCAYLAPAALYVMVYLTRYWAPSKLPAPKAIAAFLNVSWARTFAPSVLGLRLPAGALTPSGRAIVVAVQVLFAAVVVASLLRRRRAWRAWAFFGVAFLANALIVGVPRITTWGAGIGSFLRYYPEATFLFPIAFGAAFLAFDRAETSPLVVAAVQSLWARAGTGALVVALAAHLALASIGAHTVSALSKGRVAGAYLGSVEEGLRRAVSSGAPPAIVDGTVPDYLVASWSALAPPYYNRYSEVFPLFGLPVAFDRPDLSLFRVDGEGALHPTVFKRQRGGDFAALVSAGVISVKRATLVDRDGGLCVRSSEQLSAQVEFSPPTPPAGGGLYLGLWYGPVGSRTLGISVDRGSGYSAGNAQSVSLANEQGGATLTALGGSKVRRLRLEVPPGGEVCLTRLEIGNLTDGA